MKNPRNLRIALVAVFCTTVAVLNFPTSNPHKTQIDTLAHRDSLAMESRVVRDSLEELLGTIGDLDGVMDTEELEIELARTESLLDEIEARLSR